MNSIFSLLPNKRRERSLIPMLLHTTGSLSSEMKFISPNVRTIMFSAYSLFLQLCQKKKNFAFRSIFKLSSSTKKNNHKLNKKQLCHQNIILWPLQQRTAKVFIVKKCCRLIGVWKILKGSTTFMTETLTALIFFSVVTKKTEFILSSAGVSVMKLINFGRKLQEFH